MVVGKDGNGHSLPASILQVLLEGGDEGVVLSALVLALLEYSKGVRAAPIEGQPSSPSSSSGQAKSPPSVWWRDLDQSGVPLVSATSSPRCRFLGFTGPQVLPPSTDPLYCFGLLPQAHHSPTPKPHARHQPHLSERRAATLTAGVHHNVPRFTCKKDRELSGFISVRGPSPSSLRATPLPGGCTAGE